MNPGGEGLAYPAGHIMLQGVGLCEQKDSAANADWRSTMAAGRNEYPDWLKVGTT